MLNCHKLQGDFNKPITVDTNDPSHPNVTLTCKGKIMEAIKVQPNVVNLGRLSAGDVPAEQKVKILRGDAGPIKPEVVSGTNEYLAAELQEIAAGESYELIVRAKLDPAAQRVQGKIGLRTGVPEQETLDISVFGTIMPRVSARPPTVVVPPDADTNWQQAIELDWPAGTSGFKLLEASVHDPSLAVEIDTNSVKPRVVAKVDHPIEGNLPPTTVITVKTDDPRAPVVTVPVRYRKLAQRPPAARSRTSPAGISRGGEIPVQPGNPAGRAPTPATPSPAASPAPAATPAPQ